MRIARLTFVGSIALLATAPALARNSNSNPADANAQKIENEWAAQGCHAYQKGPDGSWTELPCQEVGPASQTPTRGKSATRIPDGETR